MHNPATTAEGLRDEEWQGGNTSSTQIEEVEKKSGEEIKMKKEKKPQTSRVKNLINYSIWEESDCHASHEGPCK
jgi:hypothetical protein